MIQLLPGDCRTVLATLPANSVHMVCTSPPYYGLRDYGVDRQIGLEPTPDAYLAEMVRVFREVRRVLRPDGTVWCNLGDLYAGSPAGNFGTNRPEAGVFNTYRSNTAVNTAKHAKPKDLLLMPARLALALQADGWWLRSDIIWHKPNPMPESVTDRPTSAHEHVFLLAKSARYFYDATAIAEPSEMTPQRRFSGNDIVRDIPGSHPHSGQRGALRDIPAPDRTTRACRNVWTIATAPYSAAHFATYPPALAERCIRAGTSERGCCAACGAPWGRVTETTFVKLADRRSTRKATQDGADMADINSRNVMGYNDVATTGWAASCACGADVVPCTVLDPFAGAGTTLLVADRLQRNAIGVELNPAYTEMAMARCRDDAPLFAEPSPPPAEPPEEARQRTLF